MYTIYAFALCLEETTWPDYCRYLHVHERTLQVGEVARVQDLNPRIVLSIEWRHRARAAGIARVRGRIEPEAQMVHLDWIGRRVRRGAWKCIVEGNGSWDRAR